MAEEQQKLIRVRFSKDLLTLTKISDAKPKPFDRKEGLVKLELTVAQIFHKVLNKARVVDIFKQDEYKVLGETLYKILMQDVEVKNFFLPEFKSIYRDKKLRCRISLEFDKDAYKLAALPWEYLRIEENKEDNIPSFFIAADTNKQFDVFRTIDDGVSGELVAFKNQTEINVIAVSVNAIDNAVDMLTFKNMLEKLNRDFDKEENGVTISKFNFIPVLNPVFKNFSEMLDNEVQNLAGPYVLHFFGHAKMQDEKSYIGFLNDSGNLDWIESYRFAAIFSNANKNNLSRKPALIVMQACESGQMNEFGKGLAVDLVREGIPAVVAMQNEITEATANSFVAKFYRDLVNGDDVAEAVSKGRYFLGCEYNRQEEYEYYNNNSFGTPVLFISTDFPIRLMPKMEITETQTIKQNKKCPKCGKSVLNTVDEFHRLNNCGGKLVLAEEEVISASNPENAQFNTNAAFANLNTINASSISNDN